MVLYVLDGVWLDGAGWCWMVLDVVDMVLYDTMLEVDAVGVNDVVEMVGGDMVMDGGDGGMWWMLAVE